MRTAPHEPGRDDGDDTGASVGRISLDGLEPIPDVVAQGVDAVAQQVEPTLALALVDQLLGFAERTAAPQVDYLVGGVPPIGMRADHRPHQPERLLVVLQSSIQDPQLGGRRGLSQRSEEGVLTGEHVPTETGPFVQVAPRRVSTTTAAGVSCASRRCCCAASARTETIMTT